MILGQLIKVTTEVVTYDLDFNPLPTVMSGSVGKVVMVGTDLDEVKAETHGHPFCVEFEQGQKIIFFESGKYKSTNYELL